jgi:hypothetical protein
MQSRIMYIEDKSESLSGDARIGRVTFSRTMRSMYYDGKEFLKTKRGFKYNCIEIASGDQYWISGCRNDGTDRYMAKESPYTLMRM